MQLYLWEYLLYVIRRRLGHISTEAETYRDIRGESSHYTVPGRVPMCDRKVLYAMSCMFCMRYVYDMYAMYDMGRKAL